MRTIFVTAAVGLSLTLPAWIGVFATGAPTVTSPLPAFMIWPLFFLTARYLEWLVIASPMLLFFIWNPALFRGSPKTPRRSYVLFVVMVVLSSIWFPLGWKYGLQYQGPGYTYIIFAVNIVWIVALGVMLVRTWKKESSYWANLAVHWALFAWLGWCAFPYMGELP